MRRKETLLDRVAIELTAPFGLLARAWEAVTVAFFVVVLLFAALALGALALALASIFIDLSALIVHRC